jgi:hypothetical protein
VVEFTAIQMISLLIQLKNNLYLYLTLKDNKYLF